MKRYCGVVVIVAAVAFGCMENTYLEPVDSASEAETESGLKEDSSGDTDTDAYGDADADGDADGDADADTDADTDADCGRIDTFENGKIPTEEIHVSPDGDDVGGNGSDAAPFATIQKAAALAGPGTAVRVHSGTYSGDIFISDLSGTAEAPIWIGGAVGEAQPVIQGGSEGFHLTRVQYLILHDMEVWNTDANGINCDDGGAYDDETATHHVVFRNLYIHEIGSGGNEDCLKLSGVNDYFVLESEMTACGGGGSGSGVDQVGCHRGIVARNRMHDLSGNAVQCKGGSEDIEILGNWMENAGERALNMGGSTGFAFFRPPVSSDHPNFEARDIRAIANVFIGGTTAFAFVGCVDCVAVNNTVYAPENWVFRILQETVTTEEYEFYPSSGGLAANNIFYFSREQISTQINIGPDTAGETFSLRNNLWFAYDDPASSIPSNLPMVEENAVAADPRFFDAPSIFLVDTESPAYVSGREYAFLDGDFEGVCYRNPPTIGAFEIPVI